MHRLGVAAAWLSAACAGSALAALWTAVVLVFMRWPLYSTAVAAVAVVGGLAGLLYIERLNRLRREQPSTGQMVMSSPQKVGVTELRDILGEETFLQLSSLTGGSVDE